MESVELDFPVKSCTHLRVFKFCQLGRYMLVRLSYLFDGALHESRGILVNSQFVSLWLTRDHKKWCEQFVDDFAELREAGKFMRLLGLGEKTDYE